MTPEELRRAAEVVQTGARRVSELAERVRTEAPDLLEKAGHELAATGRVLLSFLNGSPLPPVTRTDAPPIEVIEVEPLNPKD